MRVLLISSDLRVVEASNTTAAIFQEHLSIKALSGMPLPKVTALPEKLKSTRIAAVVQRGDTVTYHCVFMGKEISVEFYVLNDSGPDGLFNPYAEVVSAEDGNPLGCVVLQLIAPDETITPYADYFRHAPQASEA